MKEPNHITLTLGHPLLAGPGSIVAMGCFIAALQDASWWPAAIIAFLIVAPVARLAEQRQAYLRWKREWDAMAGPQAPRQATPASGTAKRIVGIALLILVGIFFAANARDLVYAGALVYLVMAVAIAALAAKMFGRRKPPLAKANQPVTMCVRHPLLAVPRVADAYRALPPHCHALFAAQERQRRATSS
jgi:hypothetical protein